MIKIKDRTNKGLANKRNQTLNSATPLSSKLMKGFNISSEDMKKQCRESKVLDKKSGSARVKKVR